MAVTLTRPTLLGVPAFDATKEQIFTFAVQGATAQVVANKLIIRKQDDNTTVYEAKQESFKYQHNVAANKLTNNTYYSATVIIYDAEGNESPESLPIQFWCYTQPTITITNMPIDRVIQNSTYNFAFTYEQAEGEKLNTYIVNLYNSFDTLISTSGLQYVIDGSQPFNSTYLVAGFENATSYRIEIVGTTINNTVVSTGRLEFTVQYVRPDLFTLIELFNNCDKGYISLRSNIALIEGESNPDPPIYIDDSEVDLTNPDHWVKWESGYSITGDFLARLWFRKPTHYAQILKFMNVSGQNIVVRYMQGYESIDVDYQQAYVEIEVTSLEGYPYYIFSNYIDILPETQYYNLWLTRVNNIYQLQLAKVN